MNFIMEANITCQTPSVFFAAEPDAEPEASAFALLAALDTNRAYFSTGQTFIAHL